jgi:hypothetical protein
VKFKTGISRRAYSIGPASNPEFQGVLPQVDDTECLC